MSASRNSNFYEVNLLHPKCNNPWSLPVYVGGYSDQIDCIDKNGNVEVSNQPGLIDNATRIMFKKIKLNH